MTKPALDELKEYAQWVAYDADKIPYNPTTGARADSTNYKTWGSYNEALTRAKSDKLAGVGFVFTDLAGIVGIDIDGCIDDQGNLSPFANQVVDALNSYTEVSPSDRGLHIFVKAQLPPDARKKEPGKHFEIYSRERYFTVTGKHWPGTPESIEARPAETLEVYRFVFGDPQPAQPVRQPAAALNLSDQDILNKALSGSDTKFVRLWNGDISGYSSHSEADMALVDKLAFYTKDPAQIDRLFRSWPLCRSEKWDRLGAKTIDKALALVTEQYQPSRQNGSHPAPPVVRSEPNNEQQKPEPEQQPVFKRYSVTEYLQRPKKKWLIDNLLGEQDMVMIFGEAGTGKTFAALALAFSAALGRQFACQFAAVRPLKVAYCAGEGQNGLVNRLTASTTAFGAWQGDGQALLDQNLSIFADAPQLFNSDVEQSIYNFVTKWQASSQAGPLDILIIDTFHSATAGADENNARDAGLIIQAAKHAIGALGCAVVLVHHANKAGKYRGSSAFHGAMDGMIETEYDKETRIGKVNAFKLKDADLFSPLYFKLAYDQAAESCAIEWLDQETIQLNDKPKKGDIAREAILELLRANVALNQTQIVSQLKDEVGRHTILTALRELEETGLLITSPGEKNGKIYQLKMEF